MSISRTGRLSYATQKIELYGRTGYIAITSVASDTTLFTNQTPIGVFPLNSEIRAVALICEVFFRNSFAGLNNFHGVAGTENVIQLRKNADPTWHDVYQFEDDTGFCINVQDSGTFTLGALDVTGIVDDLSVGYDMRLEQARSLNNDLYMEWSFHLEVLFRRSY